MKLLDPLYKAYKKQEDKNAEIFADEIKNKETVQKSKRLGIKSIIYSSYVMLLIMVMVVSLYLITIVPNDLFWLKIIVCPLAILVCVILIIVFRAIAVSSFMYQFKLNKTATSWGALSMTIIPIIIFIVAMIFIIISVG